MISRLTPGLRCLLPTLHERRCHCPCKARFRLAGCAFAGRELNPLDRSERFQATSVLLPRTSPDASWAHGRRDFFKLAELAKAPVAIEAVQRIDAIFDVERTINGLPIEQRRAARQAQIGALVDDLQGWMRDVRTKMSRHADVAKASTIC
jgi:hypothetical protein